MGKNLRMGPDGAGMVEKTIQSKKLKVVIYNENKKNENNNNKYNNKPNRNFVNSSTSYI